MKEEEFWGTSSCTSSLMNETKESIWLHIYTKRNEIRRIEAKYTDRVGGSKKPCRV